MKLKKKKMKTNKTKCLFIIMYNRLFYNYDN